MWGTGRVVIDLDRSETDITKFLVGANFGDDGRDQFTIPLGFRVHKGTRFERKSNANPVPRDGLPSGRDHVDFLQEVKDRINTLPRHLYWFGIEATDQGPGRRDAWGSRDGIGNDRCYFVFLIGLLDY